jgi:hypothetical protein
MGLNLNWLGLGDLLELGIESQKQRRRGANPLTGGGGGDPTGERTALSKVAAGSHEEQHGNREHKIHARGQ